MGRLNHDHRSESGCRKIGSRGWGLHFGLSSKHVVSKKGERSQENKVFLPVSAKFLTVSLSIADFG